MLYIVPRDILVQELVLKNILQYKEAANTIYSKQRYINIKAYSKSNIKVQGRDILIQEPILKEALRYKVKGLLIGYRGVNIDIKEYIKKLFIEGFYTK